MTNQTRHGKGTKRKSRKKEKLSRTGEIFQQFHFLSAIRTNITAVCFERKQTEINSTLLSSSLQTDVSSKGWSTHNQTQLPV